MLTSFVVLSSRCGSCRRATWNNGFNLTHILHDPVFTSQKCLSRCNSTINKDLRRGEIIFIATNPGFETNDHKPISASVHF